MLMVFSKFIDDLLSLLEELNHSVEFRIAGADKNNDLMPLLDGLNSPIDFGTADKSFSIGAYIDVLTPKAMIRVTIFGDTSFDVSAIDTQLSEETFFYKKLGMISQEDAAKLAMKNIQKAIELSESSQASR